MANVSIGSLPHEIPINQLLGKQAFMDLPPAKPCAIMHHLHDDTSSSTNGGRLTEIGTSWEVVKLGDVKYDNYGAYTKSTGEYTVPRTGMYLCHIGSNLWVHDIVDVSGNSVIQFYVQINGSDYKRAYINKNMYPSPSVGNPNDKWVYMDINIHVPCRKGDKLKFTAKSNHDEFRLDDDGKYSEMVFRML